MGDDRRPGEPGSSAVGAVEGAAVDEPHRSGAGTMAEGAAVVPEAGAVVPAPLTSPERARGREAAKGVLHDAATKEAAHRDGDPFAPGAPAETRVGVEDGAPLSAGAPQMKAAGLTRLQRMRATTARYGAMLWWLHSLYALGLGTFVVLYAGKGLAHARALTVTLALAWVVLILFFRLFGSGARQQVQGRNAKLGFFVMTYVLKNIYQGMLFFLLPFYWRSFTLHSENQWFMVALGACAFLSTLDVVFDRMLMRWKMAASLFYFFTLFACLNLVIPALLPNTRAAVSLVVAAVVAALAFWAMHMPLRLLGKPLGVTLLATWTVASLAGSYFGRRAVPPAAMYVAHGAVGPQLLDDGRLAVEANALHESLVQELYAVTDIMIPGGKGDRLIHVWRHEGAEVQRFSDVDAQGFGPAGVVRLQSRLSADGLPERKVGAWSVDVITQDDQLVGRVAFEVI